MSQLDKIIPRLRQVKGRNHSFTACCPAHDDKSPSLAIRELQDGRVLLHCFGGCSAVDVVGALGLELSDLFPETDEHHKPKVRPRFYATDLLRIINMEALIVSIVAMDIYEGRSVSDEARERLLVAKNRIQEALDHA